MVGIAVTFTMDRQIMPNGVAVFTILCYVPLGNIMAAYAVATMPLISPVRFF